MPREWILTLRSSSNGYQVVIPIELAEEHDITIRDNMMVWCNGTSIEIKKHTGQSIPEHTKKTPIESIIFVKTIQPSGKSPVLTLPKPIVEHMGLEGVEKVSMRTTADGCIRIGPVARLPDPASVMHAPKSTPESVSNGGQTDNPAPKVEPFVLKDKPIYNILEKLELEDYLTSISRSRIRKAKPSS